MRQDGVDIMIDYIKNIRTKDGPLFKDHDDFKNMNNDEWVEIITGLKKIFDEHESDGPLEYEATTDLNRY